MEQTENKTEKKHNREKKELSASEIQKRKKMIVFPAMFLLFIGVMYLIFAPSSDEKKRELKGFNIDIPLPNEKEIISDKLTAYETDQFQQKQENKKRTLQDFDFLLNQNKSAANNDLSLSDEDSYSPEPLTTPKRNNTISGSAAAYNQLNERLTTVYQPVNNTYEQEQERLALEWRIQELERKLEEKDQQSKQEDIVNDQLALLEKSYEIAAKYMPNTPKEEATPKIETTKKETPTIRVQRKSESVVSSLSVPLSPTELLARLDQEEKRGFNSPISTPLVHYANTIKACIHSDQTIMAGQNILIRLLEPIEVGTLTIPRNTILSGTAAIQGERLDITISTLEYNGTILPVSLSAYDLNGQKGLFVPSSLERQALNEGAANMTTGLGSTLSISQSAGQQVAMDLTRGIMQGGSQYLSKKLRTVRVNLKANHQLLLLPKL